MFRSVDILDGLEAWAAELRTDEAVGERSRERWMRQAADDDGSMTGILHDAAE